MNDLRVGFGYDIHRLASDRRLVLGGLVLEHPTGLVGHSDGDVLLHAVMDALLGAAGLGDLGTQFPSDDAAYKDADSLALLGRVSGLVRGLGYTVASVDVTVIAEAPRIGPHVARMRGAVAKGLGIDAGRVSVKAKTNEGIGAIGAGEAIAVMATALITR